MAAGAATFASSDETVRSRNRTASEDTTDTRILMFETSFSTDRENRTQLRRAEPLRLRAARGDDDRMHQFAMAAPGDRPAQELDEGGCEERVAKEVLQAEGLSMHDGDLLEPDVEE